MAMSQDSAADSSSNMHQSPATDTNSLVSNSMLDASVPSYIPTTSYYPTSTPTAAYYFPGHHAPPYQHDIGSEVPQQQQHTYHAPDPYMHETNTSMPPPTIPYEQYYYPPFFQNLPQINQQSTPVYPIQQQFTYPVPQEYYQSEGVREELLESNEAAASGRRNSTSSTAAAVVPIEYNNPDMVPYSVAKPPVHAHTNPNPSMVHVEHCHVSVSLFPNQASGGHSPYSQSVRPQGGSGNRPPSAGNYPAAHPVAQAAMLHPVTSMMQPVQQHQYAAMSDERQMMAAAAAGNPGMRVPQLKPQYRPDTERGNNGNYRGVANRGRGGAVNLRPANARRIRRHDADNSSTSSDRNSFNGERYQYPSNERHSFSDHGDARNHTAKDIHHPNQYEVNMDQNVYVYNQFNPMVNKLEGRPLIMSRPMCYPNPNEQNYHNERMPWSQQPAAPLADVPPFAAAYLSPQQYLLQQQQQQQQQQQSQLQHKDVTPFVDPAHLTNTVGAGPNDCKNLNVNGAVTSLEPVDTTSATISNPALENLNNCVTVSVPVTSSQQVCFAPVYTEMVIENTKNQANHLPTNSTDAQPSVENVSIALETMSIESNVPVKDQSSGVIEQKVNSGVDSSSSSKVVPILDIKTENQLDLSFTMKFGDICPEEVYDCANKLVEKTAIIICDKDEKIDCERDRQESLLNKSSLTPLFDTSMSEVEKSVSASKQLANKSMGFCFYYDTNREVSSSSVSTAAKTTHTKVVEVDKPEPVAFATETVAFATETVAPTVAAVKIPCASIQPAVSSITYGVVASPQPRLQLPVVAPPHVDDTEQRIHSPTPPKVEAAKTLSSANAEKPPIPPPVAKKQQPAEYQQPAPAVASSSGSAWGKQKNWTEQFKSDSSEKCKKTVVSSRSKSNSHSSITASLRAQQIAVVQPLQCNGTMATPPVVVSSLPSVTTTTPVPRPLETVAGNSSVCYDQERTKIGAYLMDYKPDYTSVMLQPRGLTNKNYWCYSNTVLQAMVSVPQLFNLYKNMDQTLGSLITSDTMPITYSIISFLKEFTLMNTINSNLSSRARGKKAGQNMVNLPEVVLGDPFEPTCIHKMLLNKNSSQFMEGYQQDAEEMLTFLLNAGHDEFNECLKLSSTSNKIGPAVVTPSPVVLPNGAPDDGTDDWYTKGPKNKSCITRSTHFSHSPISKIFWGESRSVIKKGSSPATANLEPFITLPLDIQDEKITSVKAALEQFVSKADIDGYTCTDTQEELTVSNQRLLEQLPEVLILQLKRFVYSVDGGLQKVVKDITISVDLEINKELISAQGRKKLSADKCRYKLTSIVYHDGKEATKGHYVSDVYHAGYNCWLHYDDACVRPIPASELQRCNAPRVPYLLFYRRDDTFIDGAFPTSAIGTPANKKKNHNKRTASIEKIEALERKSVINSNSSESQASEVKDKNAIINDEKNTIKSSPCDKKVTDKASLDRKDSAERKPNQTNNSQKKRKKNVNKK